MNMYRCKQPAVNRALALRRYQQKQNVWLGRVYEAQSMYECIDVTSHSESESYESVDIGWAI